MESRNKSNARKQTPSRRSMSVAPSPVITGGRALHEDSPASTKRSPGMPSISSIRDYYTPSDIRAGDNVTAVWSYPKRTSDEFDLERGDVLTVTSIWGDGWAIGHLAKQEIDPMSRDSKGARHTVISYGGGCQKDIRAFPLVCVCASEYWDRVIDADGKPLSFDLI